MISSGEAGILFDRVLREFAPDWERVGELRELSARDPEDWISGSFSFGAIVRHRETEQLKVLGRRSGPHGTATYHRGLSSLVLKAYAERNTDPILRYLEEIGMRPRTAKFRVG